MHVQVAECYVDIIERLHASWTPHSGQIVIGRALFGLGIREIFAECGRNFGKTDFIAYALVRTAMMRPGTTNYYFAPFQKQAREILWRSRRIHEFIPEDWIADINESEMRITLINGSFIKLDGSDNTESYRGVKPPEGSLIVYDEFKDFRPEFHIAMEPNLSKSFLLIVGTPPDHDCQFTEVADEFASNPRKRHFRMPTWMNPHIDRQWLKNKKAELYAKGEGDVWEREYEAKRVKGGKAAIFPMIHNYPSTGHRAIVHEISRDMRKLEWHAVADPGTATCFATLFGAINPYTKKVYILDEIYETDQARTTTSQIGGRIVQKENELGTTQHFKADWLETADEAAQWFINEMGERYDHWFGSTNKAKNDKEAGLSLIKDLMLRELLVISDRCVKLRWEMENYIKDKNGRIPKKDDHLIDCLRYMLAAAHYTLETVQEPAEREKSEDFRGARMEDDFHQLREFDDVGIYDRIG